jgi:hypothetical protein
MYIRNRSKLQYYIHNKINQKPCQVVSLDWVFRAMLDNTTALTKRYTLYIAAHLALGNGQTQLSCRHTSRKAGKFLAHLISSGDCARILFSPIILFELNQYRPQYSMPMMRITTCVSVCRGTNNCVQAT